MQGARSLVEDPERAWVLAPSERHVEALAEEGLVAHGLRRMIRELSAECAPDRAPTTPEMTRLLSARLIGAGGSRARGVDDALGLLRRAGTRPESLRATGVERGRWLAEVLAGADRALAERGLRDDRESGWLAAKAIGSRADRFATFGSHARLLGLTRWDSSLLALVERLHAVLSRAGGGCRLELPLPSGGPLHDACAASFAQIEAHWASSQDPPLLTPMAERADRAQPAVVSAHDAASEARAVVRTVLEALERGAALDGIAIVPAELSEAFLEPLRFELGRAGIPFVEPRGRPAIAAPRAHRALELLGLAAGPIARDALIDVFRTPGLDLRRWFGDHDPVELASELARLPLRIDRTGKELSSDLDDRLSELARDDPPAAAQLRPLEGALAAFLATLAALAESAPRAAHAGRAAALFAELKLLEAPAGALREALARAANRRPELLSALGQDGVASRAMRSALERTAAAAVALGADEAVPLELYVEELNLALEGSAPLSGAARAGAVRIARPVDVAGLSFDQLVLCRASDAVLDRNPSPNAVLGDRFCALLPAAERPPSALAEHRFDLLAIASVLAGARATTVTFASHDGNSTLGPSRLALWLRTQGAPFRREPASPLAAFAGRTTPLAEPSPGAARRLSIERGRALFFMDPEAVADAYSGRTPSLARHLGGSLERPIAVTALERALRCRFLGFMGSVLRANRDDPVSDAISARERGSLLHAALAEALEATRGRAAVDTAAELEARALAAAEALLERKGRGALRRAGLAATLLDVRAILKKTFASDEGLSFLSAELGFGRELEWPPLALGTLHVSGRIDRIDVSSDRKRLRVIDYKTRLDTKSDEAVELQPWLYAEKAGRELGASQTSFAYFALNRRDPELRSVYEGPLAGDAVRRAFERAEQLFATLAEGHVEPVPLQRSYCVRCLARDACRRPLSAPDPNADRGEP
jgi:ATP-dependent helicase/nuclease subunit B